MSAVRVILSEWKRYGIGNVIKGRVTFGSLVENTIRYRVG